MLTIISEKKYKNKMQLSGIEYIMHFHFNVLLQFAQLNGNKLGKDMVLEKMRFTFVQMKLIIQQMNKVV
jgi:hypothetical protein